MVCVYVDDLIFTGNDLSMFNDFREAMTRHFEMTDMGLMSYFLGLEVVQTSDGIFVSQQKYTADVLKKFKMESCTPIKTPKQAYNFLVPPLVSWLMLLFITAW